MASGCPKLRGSVNKAEERKTFLKERDLMSEPQIKGIDNLIPGGLHCCVCVEIPKPNRLYEAPGGSRRLATALFEQRRHIMARIIDVVCLFCGRFAEVMEFYGSKLEEMKWHHLMFVLPV